MEKMVFNYQLVNERREKLGITHKYLASYLSDNGQKISEQGVKNWFLKNDKLRMSPEMPKLILIGKLLKLEPNEMLTGFNEPKNLVNFNYYPDITASAGHGLINNESKLKILQVDNEFARKILHIEKGKQFDLIRIRGNSMSPLLNDGEFVVVDRTIKLVSQLTHGDIVIFRQDEALYCKYIKIEPFDTKHIYLLSENKEYREIEVKTFEECELIGKVITKLSIQTFKTMLELVQ